MKIKNKILAGGNCTSNFLNEGWKSLWFSRWKEEHSVASVTIFASAPKGVAENVLFLVCFPPW